MSRWLVVLAVVAAAIGTVSAGVVMLLPSVAPMIGTLGAPSDVRAQINHQGVVSVSGVRFEGTGYFRFQLVDASNQVVWQNHATNAVSLTVTDGVYSVNLGDTDITNMAAIDRSLFADGNLKLRVWFGNASNTIAQLSPDYPLTSSPYAFTVADAAVTTAKIKDGDVTNAKLAAAVAEALVPAGAIIPYGGTSTPPTGWLLCDGQAVSRTTYSDLFTAIGTTYGAGDGSTTFNVPNLKGRAPVGLDAAQGEFDALGETGGAKTHTLTESEMPSHTHSSGTLGTAEAGAHTHSVSGTAASDGSHSHTTYAFQFTNTTATGGQNRLGTLTGSGSQNNAGSTSSDGAHTHSVSGTAASAGAHSHSVTGSTGSTGSGSAHNNLQPYIVLNYIIKH